MQISTFLRQRKERLRELKRDMKALSPLQRRTFKRINAQLIVILFVDLTTHFTSEYGSLSKNALSLFTLLLAFPVLATIIILGRYLANETDEFVRMIVVRALLWGAAVIVAGDTIQSVLQAWGVPWDLNPGGLIYLNSSLFIPAFMLALAVQLRRNR
jgi:hypothetical protein